MQIIKPLATALVFLSTAISCFANEKLSGVAWVTCSKQVCLSLSSESMYRSELDTSVHAFASAQLELKYKSRTLSLAAEDGFVDHSLQRVILRGLKKSKHREVIVNMVNGELMYFD